MTPKIKTYQDLLDEKARLEAVVSMQKQVVRDDIEAIKEELAPVRSAMSWVSKFFTRDTRNWVVNAGLNTAIDFAFKRVLLARAGWFTKILVPFFVKNFTSHVVEEKKLGIIGKLLSKLMGKKKNKNRTQEHAAGEAAPGAGFNEDAAEG